MRVTHLLPRGSAGSLVIVLLLALLVAVAHKATATAPTPPDIIIAGVMKAGTTDLEHTLRKHPHLAVNEHEIHYLDACTGGEVPERTNQPCGNVWNASQRSSTSVTGVDQTNVTDPGAAASFNSLRPTANAYANCTVRGWFNMLPKPTAAGQLVTDKTPKYIAHADYIRLMHELAPKAKVIVALREPVARVWSEFKMTFTRRHKRMVWPSLITPVKLPMSMAQARTSFHEEATAYTRAFHGQCPTKPLLKDHFERGFYVEQLQYLYSMYPPEQVLVLISEDLWEANDYAPIDAFLGLDPPLAQVVPPKASSTWANKGAGGELDSATKAKLDTVYRASNERLCTLLKKHGYPCPRWAPTEYAAPNNRTGRVV